VPNSELTCDGDNGYSGPSFNSASTDSPLLTNAFRVSNLIDGDRNSIFATREYRNNGEGPFSVTLTVGGGSAQPITYFKIDNRQENNRLQGNYYQDWLFPMAVYVGSVAEIAAGTAVKCGATYSYETWRRRSGFNAKTIYGNCHGAVGTQVTLQQEGPFSNNWPTNGQADDRYLSFNEMALCTAASIG